MLDESNAELDWKIVIRKLNELGRLYRTYQKRLFSSGAMDFTTPYSTYVLLRDHPNVLNKYRTNLNTF